MVYQNFEHKIILSIATRLLAEKYMQIKDVSNKLDTTKKTGKIIKQYEKESNDKLGISKKRKSNIHILLCMNTNRKIRNVFNLHIFFR